MEVLFCCHWESSEIGTSPAGDSTIPLVAALRGCLLAPAGHIIFSPQEENQSICYWKLIWALRSLSWTDRGRTRKGSREKEKWSKHKQEIEQHSLSGEEERNHRGHLYDPNQHNKYILNTLSVLFVFEVRLHWAACRIFVPQPGLNPWPLHLKCRVLATGPPGNLNSVSIAQS